MKAKRVDIKKIAFGIILMLLVFTFFQSNVTIIKTKGLRGVFIPAPDTVFTLKRWISGDYQLKKEKFLNENFGFRTIFVRLSNQIAYSLFDKAEAFGVVFGKHNYFYDENYIHAYYGTDYIGTDSTMIRMAQVKFLHDTLSKLNKTLILIFAPGKASFFPEHIPDSYKIEKKTTNYEALVREAENLGLNYIDFYKYFNAQKNKSKYPLYPQFGIHWSYYGLCLAADSMIKYMEWKRNIDMPDIYWDRIDISSPQKDDYDIGECLNLFFQLKTYPMAYPQVKIESDSGKTKPSVMVIADSYYYGMFNLGISKVFTNGQFWYYNREIHTEPGLDFVNVNSVNLKHEIMNHDVIIILSTEANLSKFGWQFIENAFREFHNEMSIDQN